MRPISKIQNQLHQWLSLTPDDDPAVHTLMLALAIRVGWSALFGFLLVALIRCQATFDWQPETPAVIEHGMQEGFGFLFHGARKRTYAWGTAYRSREFWLAVEQEFAPLSATEKMALAAILYRVGDTDESRLRLIREAVEAQPNNIELRRQMAQSLMSTNAESVKKDGLQRWLSCLEESRQVDPDNSLYDDVAANLCCRLGAPYITIRSGIVMKGEIDSGYLKKSDEYLETAARNSGLYPAKICWPATRQLAERIGIHRAALLAYSSADPGRDLPMIPALRIEWLDADFDWQDVTQAIQRIELLAPRIYSLERRSASLRSSSHWAYSQLQKLRYRIESGEIAQGHTEGVAELKTVIQRYSELDEADPIYELKQRAIREVYMRMNNGREYQYFDNALSLHLGLILLGCLMLLAAVILFIGGRWRPATNLKSGWVVPLRILVVGVCSYLVTCGYLRGHIVRDTWLLFVIECWICASVVLVARLLRGTWLHPEFVVASLLLTVAWAFPQLPDGYPTWRVLEQLCGSDFGSLRFPVTPFAGWVAGGGLQMAVLVVILSELAYAFWLRRQHASESRLSLRRLLFERLVRPTLAIGLLLLATGLYFAGGCVRDCTTSYRIQQLQTDNQWSPMIMAEIEILRRDKTVMQSCRAEVLRQLTQIDRSLRRRFAMPPVVTETPD